MINELGNCECSSVLLDLVIKQTSVRFENIVHMLEVCSKDVPNDERIGGACHEIDYMNEIAR